MGLAAVPVGPVDIPPVVERLASGNGITPDRIVPVWRNELGGLTFRLGDDRYVKWNAQDAGSAPGTTPDEWMPEHRGLTVAGVREALRHPPPIDDVVCHGDACAPNTLLDAEGRVAGHVDLGRLGVGDRWADLAVAAWSTVWNYGPGYEAVVYAAYGVEPDEKRIRYYRLLWDVS